MSLRQRLIEHLPFTEKDIGLLVATAPFRYKTYRIPKRRVGQFRTIAQPTAEIKLLQRWMTQHVLSELPVHPAAFAYRPNRSIKDHAQVHASSNFLLKMDFRNFFNSIEHLDVRDFLAGQKIVQSEDDLRVMCQLLLWLDKPHGRLCLSVGAPSSPPLTNAMLFCFDELMSGVTKRLGVSYSRYADDLAFSAMEREPLVLARQYVEDFCVQSTGPALRINPEKTVLVSNASRRVLVGLVLTPARQVSLGRERKREYRAQLYRFTLGLLSLEQIGELRGNLAFAWSIEPRFIAYLVRRYGRQTMEQLDLPFGRLSSRR